ncbi:related to mitochondrial carrier family protein [Melanopsichium pennsylvanicum]|uniref:Related to mitochondrial carrier family protein n=2 Tax=Melanopsichium pennsylvanicum TaxID=63383 RepID=A0AAJ4XG84_9BASI|nr:related to mitochondrial carrier family protein [Melanopsichium pennsylvanicum 4]SNX81516.1 related to mitochondrial carrier family protein [Melanopsichium pennsylvanicum]
MAGIAASASSSTLEPELFPSMASNSLERPQSGHRRSSFGQGAPRKRVSRSKKAIAAVTGAVTTSFLMTPFDVIKTRLQTQSSAEPLFFPSQHLASSSSAQAGNGAMDKGKGVVRGNSAGLANGALQAHPATCCQQTFFTSNRQPESILCRYDPRQASTSATATPSTATSAFFTPGSSSKSSTRSPPRTTISRFGRHTTSFSSTTPPRSSVRILPSPPPAPSSYLHPTPSAVTANGTTSCACAFPNQAVATRELKAAAAKQGRLTGLWDGVIKVGKAEGVRGLWRGLAPTLMMTVPGQVTYMSCYDFFRTELLASEATDKIQAEFRQASALNGRGSGLAGTSPNLTAVTAQSLCASLLAGALARGISATLVTPLELIRTRLQASSRSQASLSSILRGLWVEMRTTRLSNGGGPLILWRGLTPTLWRDVPFSAIYFAGYEAIKRSLTGGGLGEGHASGSGEEFGVAFASGAVSGSLAAVLTHPFDVVKTRLQTQGSSSSSLNRVEGRLSGSLRGVPTKASGSGSVWATIKHIVDKEGGKGLWKGLSPRTAKVAPACGVMIASFEVVGRALADLDI